MLYKVAKPLRYFQIGSVMDIDPLHPVHIRLISDGTLVQVEDEPKPEAEYRETKPSSKSRKTK